MRVQVLATHADFPTASDSRKYEVFLDLEIFCISSVGVPTRLRCELDKGINVKVESRGCPSPGGPLGRREAIVKAVAKLRPGPQSQPNVGELPEARDVTCHIPTS